MPLPTFPDITNPTLFPSFFALPLSPSSLLPLASAPSTSSNAICPNQPYPSTPPHTLLATLQQEMTISTSPTFICNDLSGQSFALTIRLPAAEIQDGIRGGGFDFTKWKKGYVVLAKNARRSGVVEGKQGFVVVGKEDAKVIPVKMEKLLEMHARTIIREEKFKEFIESEETSTEPKGWCQSCGCVKMEMALKKCMGCEGIWYCGKECQVKDWREGSHKGECKVYQAFVSLHLSDLWNGRGEKSVAVN